MYRNPLRSTKLQPTTKELPLYSEKKFLSLFNMPKKKYFDILGKSKNFHTYSLKMGEKSFDESKYQRLIADYCQTNHHEILVNQEDVLNSIYTHMAHIDEPNGNGAAIPSFILAKRVLFKHS